MIARAGQCWADAGLTDAQAATWSAVIVEPEVAAALIQAGWTVEDAQAVLAHLPPAFGAEQEDLLAWAALPPQRARLCLQAGLKAAEATESDAPDTTL